MRTLIRHGTVVEASWSAVADVLIDNGRITALTLADSDISRRFARNADRIIDADSRLVLPGGVDVHTHMEEPFGGTVASDSFETGTRAAAWGGTTTIVDYAVQTRGRPLGHGLDQWHRKADGRSAIDYAFHMVVTDLSLGLREMRSIVAAGVTSFKVFMAYPNELQLSDGDILLVMKCASQVGALTLVHAENGSAIDVLVRQSLASGHTSPRFHGITRPPQLESEAAYRAIQLAAVAKAPLYIVHLSSADAVAHVATARGGDQRVFGETCPQYLYLSQRDLSAPGFEGAKFVCSPPLRPSAHHSALWNGLAQGHVQVVATDHCPFNYRGQKDLGVGDFSRIPNGLPGVEHRLDLVYQGVRDGRLSPTAFVDVTSASPARLFGLYPRKGTLQPGADADVVLYAPKQRHTLGVLTHHMNVDYSCYEGLVVTGAVETVLLRGKVIVDSGKYVGRPSDGRYVPRQIVDYVNLPSAAGGGA